MITIENGRIHDNGRDTGIEAKFTASEIQQQYGWTKYQRQKSFNDTGFRRLLDMHYKRLLTHQEVQIIYNWFGIP